MIEKIKCANCGYEGYGDISRMMKHDKWLEYQCGCRYFFMQVQLTPDSEWQYRLKQSFQLCKEHSKELL